MCKIIQPSLLKGNQMTQPIFATPEKDPSSPDGKKLLDQYRDALRVKRYSPRTEDAYTLWVKNYILYHNKRHPKEMGVPEIGQFLTDLVSSKEMSVSRQNQALSATLRVFLYRHVLHIALDELALTEFRPQRAKAVPTVPLAGRSQTPARQPHRHEQTDRPGDVWRRAARHGDHASESQRY